MKTWVNGIESRCVSPDDRGLQYGDGVFETMRVANGKIEYWAEHQTRLQDGCQRLKLNIELPQLLQQLDMVLEQVPEGVLKLIVTRGQSERGYKISGDEQVTLIWMLSNFPEYPSRYYQQGIDVHICETMVSRNPVLAGIKHLNRLENVLARQEWQNEYQEGLMCDEFGNIIEGTMSNFIAIKQNTVITPDLSMAGVAGVMRQQVLDIARQAGMTIEVRDVAVAELETFDAVLMSNSLIGVWPVRRIGNYQYKPHPFCQSLVSQLGAGVI